MLQLSPENNSITKPFQQAGIENKTAWDSQALIQLKNEYCDQKRCLQCAVGNSILAQGIMHEKLPAPNLFDD